MTKFITLSEVCSDKMVRPVVLNANYMVSIKKGIKGEDTHIAMFSPSDKHYYYFVKETVEQIRGMLGS